MTDDIREYADHVAMEILKYNASEDVVERIKALLKAGTHAFVPDPMCDNVLALARVDRDDICVLVYTDADDFEVADSLFE
jgi:hypothetical protein